MQELMSTTCSCIAVRAAASMAFVTIRSVVEHRLHRLVPQHGAGGDTPRAQDDRVATGEGSGMPGSSVGEIALDPADALGEERSARPVGCDTGSPAGRRAPPPRAFRSAPSPPATAIVILPWPSAPTHAAGRPSADWQIRRTVRWVRPPDVLRNAAESDELTGKSECRRSSAWARKNSKSRSDFG